jgi:hypothetical protein
MNEIRFSPFELKKILFLAMKKTRDKKKGEEEEEEDEILVN